MRPRSLAGEDRYEAEGGRAPGADRPGGGPAGHPGAPGAGPGRGALAADGAGGRRTNGAARRGGSAGGAGAAAGGTNGSASSGATSGGLAVGGAASGSAGGGGADSRAERRRARVRSTIADAAIALFQSRGYDATTVEDVAAAVDMSPRTVFRYFPFKEDMLRAAVHLGLAELLAALRARPADQAPAAALGDAVTALWRQEGKDPEEVRTLVRLIDEQPRVRGLLLEVSRTNLEELADALAPRLGRPADDLVTRVAAAASLATLNVVMATWATMPPGTDLAPLVDTAVAELAAGPLRPRR